MTPRANRLKKNAFFLLRFVQDNGTFPIFPMTAEELKIRNKKAFLKVYPVIPQNGRQGLIIDLTLLESLAVLTLNFAGWSQYFWRRSVIDLKFVAVP